VKILSKYTSGVATFLPRSVGKYFRILEVESKVCDIQQSGYNRNELIPSIEIIPVACNFYGHYCWILYRNGRRIIRTTLRNDAFYVNMVFGYLFSTTSETLPNTVAQAEIWRRYSDRLRNKKKIGKNHFVLHRENTHFQKQWNVVKLMKVLIDRLFSKKSIRNCLGTNSSECSGSFFQRRL